MRKERKKKGDPKHLLDLHPYGRTIIRSSPTAEEKEEKEGAAPAWRIRARPSPAGCTVNYLANRL